jgi:hypothetical protein
MSNDQNELELEFKVRYEKVAATDLEVLRMQRMQVGDHWDLGDTARQLKASLGHGNWLPWVRANNYSERTVQRALKIRDNFPKREDCLSLTVAVAEMFRFGEPELDKATQDAVEKAAVAFAKRVAKKRSKFVEEETKRLDEDEAKLAKAAGEAEEEPQLLTEAVVGSGSLQDVYSSLHGDEEHDGEPDPNEDEEPEPLWEHLWDYIVECLAGTPAEHLTDAESAAVGELVEKLNGPERAVQVMLVWARLLLAQIQ